MDDDWVNDEETSDVCGTAALGGDAPVLFRDGEMVHEVQRDEASQTAVAASSGTSGNGGYERRVAAVDAVDDGDGVSLHQRGRGEGQATRQSEGVRRGPKTGGTAHRGGRNRRRSAAVVAELDDEIGEPGGEIERGKRRGGGGGPGL